MSAPTDGRVSVSVAPPTSWHVEYYGTIERVVLLTNEATTAVLVEEVALHFQPDFPGVALVEKTHAGLQLSPNETALVRVNIRPTALYKSATNVADVRVKFRRIDKQVGAADKYVLERATSVIVIEPQPMLPRVFVSIKQPEDVELGRTMALIARRAGFQPFLKAASLRPGVDLWDDIEPQLSVSRAALVIWTDNTDFGGGVEREITYCQANGVQDVLLLQQDIEVPAIYRGGGNDTKERVRFDPENPAKVFAKVIESLRDEIGRSRIA